MTAEIGSGTHTCFQSSSTPLDLGCFSGMFCKLCFDCSTRGLSVDSLCVWTYTVSSLVSSPIASLAWFSVVFVNPLVERFLFGLYYFYFNLTVPEITSAFGS